jgi:hypothetical protein
MKKVILVLTALVLVASGVAAVSAYEAHTINVKAKVENALSVNTSELNFGTVFPQEWLWDKREVKLSQSAIDELEEDLVQVNCTFFAEWKECTNETGYFYDSGTKTWDAGTVNYCQWMGDFLYVAFDLIVPVKASNMYLIGPALAPPPSAQVVPAAPIAILNDGGSHNLYIAIDVPVFEEFYNDLTDPDPKPSGENDPTYIIPDGSMEYTDMPVHPAYDPSGMNFGIDLKIQVTDIIRALP